VWLNFERLIEAMEADATEADREWKSNLSNVLFTFLEPKVLADYKAEGTDCENARGTFNSEWNQIVLGRGDPKKLLAAYDIYSLRIGALQRANERNTLQIWIISRSTTRNMATASESAVTCNPTEDWARR
jgi:hypothetical protein